MNTRILLLCKSLPASTQTDALIFLMKYSKLTFLDEFDFLRIYYAPAWSIIYWLVQSQTNATNLAPEDINSAMTAHCMAMLLHPLDDHLNDGEIPATHLNLLLRSQAWMTMITAFGRLADGVAVGDKLVRRYLDDYYSSIRSAESTGSLQSYCELFRKQMATWLISPVLLAKKKNLSEEFAVEIESAYASFGVAWRLLDDIVDIEADLTNCSRSAVYAGLPESMQHLWLRPPGEDFGDRRAKILQSVMETRIVDQIIAVICAELESAAIGADNCGMKGLGDEYRGLALPLRSKQVSR